MFILSWFVTFSIQVVTLMGVWTVGYFLFPTAPYKHVTQDALTLYGALIAVVFYMAILPLNGMPGDWKVGVLDGVVHLVLPGLFAYAWVLRKKPFQCEGLFYRLLLYPAVYLCFAHYVSTRRGYLIYPLLDNPLAVGAVTGCLYGIFLVMAAVKKK